jgi:putative transposase
MSEASSRILLFVHVICITAERKPLLKKPVRQVLMSFIRKNGEEKGINILAAGGAEDHIHLLIRLGVSRNLSQLMASVKEDAADWLRQTTLAGGFDWENDFAANTVSPSGVKQIIDFISNQEEYHKTKTLDSELAVFDKIYI